MTLDEKARAFAKEHPTHDGGTWHLWCASLMYRMCAAYGVGPLPVPSSAHIAGDLAGKLNPDYTKAPIGAFHYWQYGVDGHVGLDIKGGGTSVFMASVFIREPLGNSIGFQSVTGYTRNEICPYRGWSMLYGKNGKINQEAVMTTPVVAPKPVVALKPVLSVAQQWAISEGLFNVPVDWNAVVTYNILAWVLYKFAHRKV